MTKLTEHRFGDNTRVDDLLWAGLDAFKFFTFYRNIIIILSLYKSYRSTNLKSEVVLVVPHSGDGIRIVAVPITARPKVPMIKYLP